MALSIAVPRRLDESLHRPFRYLHRMWRDGPSALRQELVQLSDRWKELGLPGSCSYSVTSEALAAHKKHHEEFELVQEMRRTLVTKPGTTGDGWVAVDDGEATVEAHRHAFETVRAAIVEEADPDMPVEKFEACWTFDIPE